MGSRWFERGRVLGFAALISSLYSTTAISADAVSSFDEGRLPAVDGLNGKLDFSYLNFDTSASADDVGGGVVIGSLSTPIGEQFGFQVDVGFGNFDGSNAAPDIDTFGIGGHLFTRDPDVGLLGIYGDYVELDFGAVDVSSIQVGVEAEFYLDQVSLEAFVGSNTVEAGANDQTFASLDFTVGYYVNDDFRIEGGVTREFNQTVGSVGFETILPTDDNNLSVYANASFGDDQESVRAGVRVYLGQSTKSLKDRHRQDDPFERLFDFNSLVLEEVLFGIQPITMCGEGSGYSCT
ncbi:MAG: hypothetical protein AAGA53_05280 [Pseudomonadota bacterium]